MHISGLGRLQRSAVVAVGISAVVAAMTAPAVAGGAGGKGSDVRPSTGDYNSGKPLPLSKQLSEPARGKESDTYQIGTTRRWPALDDVQGAVYNKNFRLRGIGKNVEIWVADNLAFPAGDCRNSLSGGAATRVTDAQVSSFVSEFDKNMYPKESVAFSTPKTRDGSNTPTTRAYAQYYNLPARNYKGPGDRIVVLVDNVRDMNYYKPTDPDGRTYIAGFYWSLFTGYTNRNLMTVDGFDWLHRTGATPADSSGDPAYKACAAFLGRPGLGSPSSRLYEGTFAHEYQHLLEHDADPSEVNWVNEGLSDWAQSLVGYVNPKLDPADPEADGHIATFLGFGGPGFGGPEQSVTAWEDQGGPEILSDYGAAYSFMEYLYSHFGGDAFMSTLHRGKKQGLAGLQEALGSTAVAQDVLHDFLASMAVDQAIDKGASVGEGVGAVQLQTQSMSARINWANPQGYDSPGAPNNGADYVPVADASAPLVFDGAEGYAPAPVEWTQQDGLYSGRGDDLDRGIAREITVPADGKVTIDMSYDTEAGWDFAFVQRYDALAKKWVSLANGATTAVADPDAAPEVVANLPGLTGSGARGLQTFDLGAAVGSKVLLAIRYITDGAEGGSGVHVYGVSAGGAVDGATTLSTWKSLTEAVPVPVAGWTVQLVGISGEQVAVRRLSLASGNTWTGVPKTLLGFTPQQTAVLVTADDPSERQTAYAPYVLTSGGTAIGR
jgi:hypothetical protein